MLKALGQPTFTGKKKAKQITTLVQAVITVKFPDEVSMINKCMKTGLLCKYTYSGAQKSESTPLLYL